MTRKDDDFAAAGHVERIKLRGVFDLQKLYKALQQWFIEQGYEFHEKNYKHKVPSPLGAEQEITWWGWKNINEYVKFNINIMFHIWDLKEVEVVKDGVKKKMNSGRLLIEFSGKVEYDYSNRFGGSKFLQNLQDWYHKYIINKDIDFFWTDELYYVIYKVYTLAKETLEMEASYNAAAGRY